MYLADLQIEHFKVGEYKEDLWNLLKLTHVTLPQESPSFVQECSFSQESPFFTSLLGTGVSLPQHVVSWQQISSLRDSLRDAQGC